MKSRKSRTLVPLLEFTVGKIGSVYAANCQLGGKAHFSRATGKEQLLKWSLRCSIEMSQLFQWHSNQLGNGLHSMPRKDDGKYASPNCGTL
ncbi:hypothetical protein M513_01150 [Trichuris suis]|uniref:Uncharacterized protein n=1 Tax=Trichuris suis TaxID=68888 RepID=A0A085ML21_9BILA|nr:hypothetical protein M513_01150 [Trichuris suis]